MYDPAVVLRPGQSSNTPKYDSPANGVPVNQGMYYPPAGDQQHQGKGDAESQSQAETGSIAPTPAACCCGLTKRVAIILGVVLAVVVVLTAVGAGVGVSLGSHKSPTPSPPPSLPPTAQPTPDFTPTAAPTPSEQTFSSDCNVDKECAAVGGICNQGSCSGLLPYAYSCVTAGDCFSNYCAEKTPTFIGKTCYISAGDVCLVDSDCALGSCLPYGSGNYCDSVWHSDIVPDYVAGKTCIADINCGGLTHVCISGECRTGKKYFEVCTASTECAGTAICFAQPSDVKRCTLPVGSACVEDYSCPGVCGADKYCT